MSFAEDRPLAEPACWISLRTAEPAHCAVSISGSLTADAARLVRRWVVLLRDAAHGRVALHCGALAEMDPAGAALLEELVRGLEAQHRSVDLLDLSPRLQQVFPDLARLVPSPDRVVVDEVEDRGAREGREVVTTTVRPMADDQRVSIHRRIDASPSEIFVVITDPTMHVEIDGSGMLVAAPDARPLERVGDTFEMDMDREPLGDIPLGKYQVLNTVTRISPDAALEWNVGAADRGAFGHVYGYELAAAGDGGTDVTLYCDWSGVPPEMLERVTFPVVPAHMLEQSLENLDRIMTTAGS